MAYSIAAAAAEHKEADPDNKTRGIWMDFDMNFDHAVFQNFVFQKFNLKKMN
jgi:hypothetical protein